MFEAYDYIPSKYFIHLVEEHCPSVICSERKHGYTCSVETESDNESFVVIEDGPEEMYIYYDTRAARKRTQLHPDQGREYEVDHVKERITNPHQSPRIVDYLEQHENRLIKNRDEAPDSPVLGSIGKGDNERLYDVIFENENTPTEDEIQEAFCAEIEERSQQLNADKLEEARHNRFEKMLGWRIEPLKQGQQPDIVLELILFGAYEQVISAMQST